MSEVAAKYPLKQAGAPASEHVPPGQVDASEISLGTGTFIGGTVGSPTIVGSGKKDDLTLNFQAADIHEVVKAILGELLGANYIIEQGVTGTVTTDTTGGLRKSDLITVLEMLLQQSNAALVDEGGLYRIVPISKSMRSGLGFRNGRADPTYGMQIISLRHIAVSEMQKIIDPILHEDALIYAD
ncbi:MAG: type II secretion system protein GspD, partial [Proteobacteria bacterium]|nr:type II secretion system protein GspD [Pseudomonadota bacterium]